MKSPSKHGFSLKKFLAIPEVEPPLEFFGGRTIQKMAPRMAHCVIQQELISNFNRYSRPLKLGRAIQELRCTFGGNSYVFDFSFFVQARIPKLMSDDVTLPPELAVEILSPGQTVRELSTKLRAAIRRGVKLGWLIHPYKKYVLVFEPDLKPRKLEAGDCLILEKILPGFRLPIDELFGWLNDDDA